MGDSPTTGVFEFGGFTLYPARRLLTRAGGEPVAITAKAFDALVYLVQRAGQVVPRAALAEALWPTTIVEDNNLSQTILALRRVLGDAPDGESFVVTVPRRGYQFVAVVRSPELAVAGPSPGGARWPRYAAMAAGVVSFATLAGWLFLHPPGGGEGVVARGAALGTSDERLRSPLANSVAVLPFQNLSPSADDAYFAEGMHEEVLSQLARIGGVNVIGRTSVLRYARDAPPAPAIAAELNVESVVEGSVRYADQRVRVSVRLLDGATSAELWSGTYDATLDDVFRVQAEIATQIAAELEPTLVRAARVPAPLTGSAAAYTLYLRTLSLYRAHGGIGVSMPVPIRTAIKGYLDEALRLDPNFGAALAWRANLMLDELMFGTFAAGEWASASADLIRSIEMGARRALELDPTLGVAYATLARLDMYRSRFGDAGAALDRALELAPNDSVVLHYSAMVHFLRDEPDAAIAAARRALELDPKNPAPHAPLSMALRARGELPAAIATYEAMIEAAPTAAIGYIGLARTLTATSDDARVVQTLRVGEQFLADLRSFRLDAALSYAHSGAHADAERLVADFERRESGLHIDPGVEAMAALARGDYARARDVLATAVASRGSGMDPLPLAQIRQNTWSDPELDGPEWVALRGRLANRD